MLSPLMCAGVDEYNQSLAFIATTVLPSRALMKLVQETSATEVELRDDGTWAPVESEFAGTVSEYFKVQCFCSGATGSLLFLTPRSHPIFCL